MRIQEATANIDIPFNYTVQRTEFLTIPRSNSPRECTLQASSTLPSLALTCIGSIHPLSIFSRVSLPHEVPKVSRESRGVVSWKGGGSRRRGHLLSGDAHACARRWSLTDGEGGRGGGLLRKSVGWGLVERQDRWDYEGNNRCIRHWKYESLDFK